MGAFFCVFVLSSSSAGAKHRTLDIGALNKYLLSEWKKWSNNHSVLCELRNVYLIEQFSKYLLRISYVWAPVITAWDLEVKKDCPSPWGGLDRALCVKHVFLILSTKLSGKVRLGHIVLLTCSKTLSTISSQEKTNKKWNPLDRKFYGVFLS